MCNTWMTKRLLSSILESSASILSALMKGICSLWPATSWSKYTESKCFFRGYNFSLPASIKAFVFKWTKAFWSPTMQVISAEVWLTCVPLIELWMLTSFSWRYSRAGLRATSVHHCIRLWMFFASLYNNIRLYVYIQYLLILAPKGIIGTDISMLNFVMEATRWRSG